MSISCDEVGCPVATGGRCLNGFDPPLACPHYREDAPPPTVELTTLSDRIVERLPRSSINDEPEPIAKVTLNRGFELSEEEAVEIALSEPTVVVVVAGPVGCGKSTIFAQLYEMFLVGKAGEWTFAGSQTLVAFEERCHRSRVASGNKTPHMLRTPTGSDRPYLHLRLRRSVGTRRLVNLLLADLSGEEYETISRSDDAARNHTPLTRMHTLSVMIDGGSLSSPRHRETAKYAAQQIVRRLLGVGLLRSQSSVQTVVSKWDKLIDAGESVAEESYENLATRFAVRFAQSVGRFSVRRVAAISMCASVPPGYGILDLLEDWVSPRAHTEKEPVAVKSERYFGLYSFDLEEDYD